MQQAQAQRNPFTGKLFLILNQSGNGNFELVSTHKTRVEMVKHRRPGQLGFTLDGLKRKIEIWKDLPEMRIDKLRHIEELIRTNLSKAAQTAKDGTLSEGSKASIRQSLTAESDRLKALRKEIQNQPMPNLEQLRNIVKTVEGK